MFDIRPATPADAGAISALLIALSEKYIAHEFTPSGREYLLATMATDRIATTMRDGFRYHVAQDEGRIVGVVGVCDGSHLYHLFVAESHQRRGLARELWRTAMAACLELDGLREFTVNSSLHARPFYERLGFVAVAGPRDVRGVVSVPMRMTVMARRARGRWILRSGRLCRRIPLTALEAGERITMIGGMPNDKPVRPAVNDGVAFLMGFLRNPEQVGSVIPSSRFLERRIVAMAGVAGARTVIELGPGTGGTTQAILDAMQAHARLLAIEINPGFVSLLSALPDPRLTVHLGSAQHIRDALIRSDLPPADVVISGIPFSTMPSVLGRQILREVWASIAPGGCFVAYQFRDNVVRLGRGVLGEPQIGVVFLNVPPMRVYHWRKPFDGAIPSALAN
jgi:phospholipid N-methyltransferase/GNAT superfamily N-acetyltransferase